MTPLFTKNPLTMPSHFVNMGAKHGASFIPITPYSCTQVQQGCKSYLAPSAIHGYAYPEPQAAWSATQGALSFTYNSPPPYIPGQAYSNSAQVSDIRGMPGTPDLSSTSISSLASSSIISPRSVQRVPLFADPPSHFYSDEDVEMSRGSPSDRTPLAAQDVYADASEYPFPESKGWDSAAWSPAQDLPGMVDSWGLTTPAALGRNIERLPHASSLQSTDSAASPPQAGLQSLPGGHVGLRQTPFHSQLCSPMQTINANARVPSQTGSSRPVSTRLQHISTHFMPPHNTPCAQNRPSHEESPQSFYTPAAKARSNRSSIGSMTAAQDLFSPDYSMAVVPNSSPNALGAAVRIRSCSRRPPSSRASFQTPHVNDPASASPPDTAVVTPAFFPDSSPAASLDISRLPEEFLERYRLTDELGAGGYGFVCAAIQIGDVGPKSKEVAVKFILKHKMGDNDFAYDHRVPTEAYILSIIQHPSVVQFLDLFETELYFILVS